MSRINKALERIKTRESSNSPKMSQVAPRRSVGRTPLPFGDNDPLQKPVRNFKVDPELLNNNHLITELMDPAIRTSYKMLRTRVLQTLRGNGWRSIAVTSASQGDGKTVTAINLAISLAGDVNQDGQFNSADLAIVFEAGKYEDGIENNATFEEGDWNGDGDFTTSDFVTALSDGGYEQGPFGAANAVPEPSTLVLLALGSLGLMYRRRQA